MSQPDVERGPKGYLSPGDSEVYPVASGWQWRLSTRTSIIGGWARTEAEARAAVEEARP